MLIAPLIKTLLLQHLLQHWAKSLMHPQMSSVGYLISKCNITVITCYANIRYSIKCSRFHLPYKVNSHVQFFTNFILCITIFKLRFTQLGKPNLKPSIVLICSTKLACNTPGESHIGKARERCWVYKGWSTP